MWDHKKQEFVFGNMESHHKSAYKNIEQQYQKSADTDNSNTSDTIQLDSNTIQLDLDILKKLG